MKDGKVFVSGKPVLYQNEKVGSPPMLKQEAWVVAVTDAVGRELKHPHLRFFVSSLTRQGHRFDIDNLAKPILGRIAPSASSVWIELGLHANEGVAVDEAEPRPPDQVAQTVYLTRPPTKSERRSSPVTELERATVIGDASQPLGLWLAFDSSATRVSDLSLTGPLKSVVDNLWPLLGGQPGAPWDHRVRDLRVTRGVDANRAGVMVALWLIG